MEKEKLINIVLSAQSGNSAALNDLFNAYYDDIYYFALKTIEDENLAYDITQESFIEIFKTLGKLNKPEAFLSWSKTIVFHQCTRYFKKNRDVIVDEYEDGGTIFDAVPEDNAEFIPGAALDQEDFKKTILAMIDKLSEEQRSAIMMYYFDESPIKQIAEIQGVSEGTVKSRLNYARNSIKASVKDYENKSGTQLYSFSFAPFVKWMFDGKFDGAMPPEIAERIAKGVSDATGTYITLPAVKNAGAAKKNISEKLDSVPMFGRILCGILAVAVALGSTIAAVNHFNKDSSSSGNNTVPPLPSGISSGSSSGNAYPDINGVQDNISTGTNTGTNTGSNATQPSNIDYDKIIESFTPTSLNTIKCTIGRVHTPSSAVWLSSGKGEVYSSDENVVTVSELGKVTAVGPGTAYVIISVNDGSLYEAYQYTVYGPTPEADLSNLPTVEGVDFAYEIENFASTSLNSYELEIGGTHSPTASVWANAGGKCYTSDASVVTVATNGTVKAVGRGVAYVIIKSSVGNMFQIYKYTVNQ